MIRRATVAGVIWSAALSGRPAFAQQSPRPIVVRVRVTGPDSLAVSGVAVTITGVAAAPIASATTDSAGRAALAFVRGDTLVRVGLRKIGYAPSVHDIVLTGTDTFSLAFALPANVQQLETVRTDQRRLSNDYIIGAAEIAASTRPLLDAYDAIRLLRPQMLGDRLRDCPYVQDLWVNGRHQPLYPAEIIPFSDTPEITFETARGVREDGSGRPALRSSFPLSHASAAYPLAHIDPRYIVEVRYTSCTMRPVAGPRSINALFLSLKPGVGFDIKRGAYIADSAVARAAGIVP